MVKISKIFLVSLIIYFLFAFSLYAKQIWYVRVISPFDNLQLKSEFYLGYYLAQKLREELCNFGFKVVAREKELKYILKEQLFNIEMGKGTIEEVSFTGARILITGSYEILDRKRIYIALKGLDIKTGVNIFSCEEAGKLEEIPYLIKCLVLDIAKELKEEVSLKKERDFFALGKCEEKKTLKDIKKCFRKTYRLSKKEIEDLLSLRRLRVELFLSKKDVCPGEALKLYVKASRPCYPYLFTIYCRNKIGRLYPILGLTQIPKPVKEFTFPTSFLLEQGFLFRVYPDKTCPKKWRMKEKLVLICSEKRILPLEQVGQAFILSKAPQGIDINQIWEILEGISPESYAFGEITFEYRKDCSF